MSTPPVQYTRTEDDVDIAWVQHGQGKPLVVSTGPMLPLNLGWEPGGIWARLAQSFRVIRFDPRGCGLSERDGVFGSFHDEAMDLEAVVNELGEPRVALMGYYIGTPAAVIAMLNEPERYTHLMLHLPIPMGGDRSGMIQQSGVSDLIDGTVENLLRLGWQHHDEAARRALLTMIAPTADEATLRNLSQTMHRYPSINRLFGLVREMRDLDLRDQLRDVEIPALISIPSEGDGFDGGYGSLGREWARMIRGARLIVANDDTPVLVDGASTIGQIAEALEEFIGIDQSSQTAGQATRTVLFTDIEGSTSMVDRLGDDEAREITREIEQLTLSAIRENQGVQVKTMGDGVLAWFSAASAGVEAAVQIQSQLANHDRYSDVYVRIGLSAGEPIAESDDLYGATVNQAARIMSMALGGEILVSALVHGLLQGRKFQFQDRGVHQLRGFRESIQLFSVDWQGATAANTALEGTDS